MNLSSHVRGLARAKSLVKRALIKSDGGMYGAKYYGVGRKGRGLESGYDVYTRETSNADKAAFLIHKHFPPCKTLEVGCAMGFVVQALREADFESYGVDISEFAVNAAPPDVRPYLKQVDASEGLPYEDNSFDIVLAFEVLEHILPNAVSEVLAEMRRVARGHVVATIPSFGENPAGMDGWFDGKVRSERLEFYKSLGPNYTGPVPYVDLMRDADGEPIEGHLTIASFAWWRKQFENAGFVVCDELTESIYPHLHEFELAGAWNLYSFALPGVALPIVGESDEDVA